MRKQVESGVGVDDGEFSKSSWGTYINRRVSGFKNDPERDLPINYRGNDAERLESRADPVYELPVTVSYVEAN